MVEVRLVVTALALVLAMFLAGVLGLRERIGIVILALLSLSWFTIDKLFEGDIVIQLSRTHAVTASDFVGVLGLLVAALLCVPRRAERRNAATLSRRSARAAATRSGRGRARWR